MSAQFIAKWHLNLAAWGVLVGVVAAAIATMLDHRTTGRVRRGSTTGTLVIGWVAAGLALHLVDPIWLLAAPLAAGVAAIGWPWSLRTLTAGKPTNATSTIREPRIAGFLERPQVLSTMAMLAAWGIWAAVPDTEVAVFAATSVTIWWLVSVGIAVDPAPAIESIGSIPAASVALALPAALIGGSAGTSWIGGLGCFATILGLWLGSWIDRSFAHRRATRALRAGSCRDGARAPDVPDVREVSAGLPSELIAVLLLLGHLAAVYWSSRVLSQATALTAAAGVATLFVAGLAGSQLANRLAPSHDAPDLGGSSDE